MKSNYDHSRSLNSLIARLPFEIHDYKFVSVIKVGKSSITFKVIKNNISAIFAAKVTPKNLKSSIQNFDALKYLNHPYIILVYDFFEDDLNNYTIFEFCPNGSLSNLIKSEKIRSKNEKLFYLKKIMDAINYIHSKGIAHRNIEPKNFLLDEYGRPKLTNFGFCEMLYFNSDYVFDADLNDGYYKAGKKGKIKLINKFFGSCPYLAPEIILNEPYDPFSADIWSLGVTFYEIVTGYHPWINQSENEMKDCICQGSILFPDSTPKPVRYLIQSMLQVDPCQRPTMKSIARFPLFKKDVPIMNNLFSLKNNRLFKEEKNQKEKNIFSKSCELNHNSTSDINRNELILCNDSIPLSLSYNFRLKTYQKLKKNGMNKYITNDASFRTAACLLIPKYKGL